MNKKITGVLATIVLSAGIGLGLGFGTAEVVNGQQQLQCWDRYEANYASYPTTSTINTTAGYKGIVLSNGDNKILHWFSNKDTLHYYYQNAVEECDKNGKQRVVWVWQNGQWVNGSVSSFTPYAKAGTTPGWTPERIAERQAEVDAEEARDIKQVQGGRFPCQYQFGWTTLGAENGNNPEYYEAKMLNSNTGELKNYHIKHKNGARQDNVFYGLNPLNDYQFSIRAYQNGAYGEWLNITLNKSSQNTC